MNLVLRTHGRTSHRRLPVAGTTQGSGHDGEFGAPPIRWRPAAVFSEDVVDILSDKGAYFGEDGVRRHITKHMRRG